MNTWEVTMTNGMLLEMSSHPISALREQHLLTEDIRMLALRVNGKEFKVHVPFGILYFNDDVVYIADTAEYNKIEPIACEEHAVKVGTSPSDIEVTDSFQGYKIGYRSTKADGTTLDAFLRVDALGVHSINTERGD